MAETRKMVLHGVRASYVTLVEPKAIAEGQDKKYSNKEECSTKYQRQRITYLIHTSCLIDDTKHTKKQRYDQHDKIDIHHYSVLIHETAEHSIGIPITLRRDLNSVKVSFDHLVEFFLGTYKQKSAIHADLSQLFPVPFVFLKLFISLYAVKSWSCHDNR